VKIDYSIEEVAAALGVSYDAIKKRAARESWPYTEQTCRGGRKRFYRFDDLPGEVKTKVALYQARQMARAAGGNHEHVYGGRSGDEVAGCVGFQARRAVACGVMGWPGELSGDAVPRFARGGDGGAFGTLPAAGCASSESLLMMPAPGGQSIPAGVPSPVDSSPAATGAGGLTGGGGADRVLMGELVAPRATCQ
jgi:hypothetical protein